MSEDASGSSALLQLNLLKGFHNWGWALSEMKRKCKGTWKILGFERNLHPLLAMASREDLLAW